MSVGPDKVETAVHTTVAAHAPCHSGLLVEVVLKLGIYVAQNGLPAGVGSAREKGEGRRNTANIRYNHHSFNCVEIQTGNMSPFHIPHAAPYMICTS